MKSPLESIHSLAAQLGEQLNARGWYVAVAESCTGGGLSRAMTDIPGSSSWFDRGLVTYSNQSKHELLAVEETLIDTHGAVSEEVALAMAHGALRNSRAHLCAAITGVAGPSGGTAEKPVGTVWVACVGQDIEALSQHHLFPGNRPAIRHQAIFSALSHLVHLSRG